MIRRSQLEIYFEVLEIINRGTRKPTRIMYQANLSWVAMSRAFEVLLDGDFIHLKRHGKGKRYEITEKGRQALTYHLKSITGFKQSTDEISVDRSIII
jgi:predicted transcriptional regulator